MESVNRITNIELRIKLPAETIAYLYIWFFNLFLEPLKAQKLEIKKLIMAPVNAPIALEYPYHRRNVSVSKIVTPKSAVVAITPAA